MKIEIVGAGPGGLYLAILLKKAGAADVRVRERNAPDATFGWGGVVFSEETLGALRDADPESHPRDRRHLRALEPARHPLQGRELRSTGHSFSAIARTRLLEILQRRARNLGVELSSASRSRSSEADLVVGADGANSLIRGLGEFGTKVEPEGSKYVWFGTDLVFDAFTFIFKETEHGLFNVHAYPYDERMSTFIVECPSRWRAAGLDAMDEQESLSFCEQLRARPPRPRALLEPLTLARLPEGDGTGPARRAVVLLGDAAHTAHFSIGSGTKLAMEDAIALANGSCGAAGRSSRRSSTTSSSGRQWWSARRPRPATARRTSGGSRPTRRWSRCSSPSTC